MHRSPLPALILLAASAAAPAAEIPWFDLSAAPDSVQPQLAHHRALACGAVGDAGLPLPGDVRLVFVSCLGGPYCPTQGKALGDYEGQLTCPPNPGARQIATMHLVSALPLERLATYYRETLEDDYVELAADDDSGVTFIEPASAAMRRPWSPRRLHLALSATRGAFRGAGYASQIRITLSVFPPNEPRPVVRCRRLRVLPDDGSVLRRLENRYCWY